MKDNDYPTIFPNCAKYLSQRKLADRPLLGSSLARAETSAKREEANRLHDIELKTVRSIEDTSNEMKDQVLLDVQLQRKTLKFQKSHSTNKKYIKIKEFF